MKLEKVSKSDRWYDDACGTAHALELVGERWALLVMRELMFGPRRFGQLRASLPGISANVLTRRLAGLEAAGIVLPLQLPPPASVKVYGLTPWGFESERAIMELGRWAARSPGHDPSLSLSAASLMLSFRTMLDAGHAAGMNARIGFRLDGDELVGHLAGGRLDIVRQAPDEADVVFSGAPSAIAGAVYGGIPLAVLEAEGALAVTGDRAMAERFVRLFPLPAKAPLRRA